MESSVKVQLKCSQTLTSDGRCHQRSKSPTPCPPVTRTAVELRRSHSHPTDEDNNRTFLATDWVFGEVLGQGFFGRAIKVTLAKTGEQMVLKDLHIQDEHSEKSFRKEIVTLRSLSHPHVLKYLGVLYREKTLNLVTEYIQGGSLSSLLLDYAVPLSWSQRIAFARDIASGMCYLHSVGIIHRDLNSRNCLVRQDRRVVVADLGLAKVISHHNLLEFHCPLEETNKEEETGDGVSRASRMKKRKVSQQQYGAVVGHPFWMAPEMMLTGIYDEKADVFSYGITLCETIARVPADPDYLPRSLDFSLNVEAFHKRFCAHAPEPYFMLAVLCAQLESEHRPSFEKIQVMCEALLLHTEHAAAVPRDLKGSTVDFYHRLKEKLYGKNYRDIDSCVQGHARATQEQSPDGDRSQGHDNQSSANHKSSFQTHDPEKCSSNACICTQRNCKHACTTGGINSSAEEIRQIQHPIKDISHGTIKSQYHNEKVHGTNKQDQLLTYHEKGNRQTCTLCDNFVSVTHPLSTTGRNFTSQSDTDGDRFHDGKPTFRSENRNFDTNSDQNDSFDNNITVSQNEDDAYFSSSSISPSSSFLSSRILAEDFSSCNSFPESSHFIQNVLVALHDARIFPDSDNFKPPAIEMLASPLLEVLET